MDGRFSPCTIDTTSSRTGIESLPSRLETRNTFTVADATARSPGPLRDQDRIYVPSVREDSPVIYISIRLGNEVTTLRHRLRDGDILLTVMQTVLLRPGRGRARVG
ncbi:MAG: hypothetical protein ACLFMV_12285, partial [Spirochaetaceae bacterium]